MTVPIAVNLVEYNPEWPGMAARHLERLRSLGTTLVAIHHIGSTSVPGMVAKPVIDLMPLVRDIEELDARQAEVAALGYRWHGEYGVSGRRYCTLEDQVSVLSGEGSARIKSRPLRQPTSRAPWPRSP